MFANLQAGAKSHHHHQTLISKTQKNRRAYKVEFLV